MKRKAVELPPERLDDLKRARRLEWLTIFFMLTIIGTLYFVLGSSQAMKTAWIEDILSLIPPIAVLIASRVSLRAPNERFPYGYHRVVSIAFLCGALALLGFGGYLFIDSALKLIRTEHPTIGGQPVFGRTLWLGWLMIPALIYSVIPPVILGRKKLKLARALHDKALHSDADMNKADWLTGLAAGLGVIGVALGLWWADSIAAIIISTSVLKDGFVNLKEVVEDLMDRRPQTVDRQALSDLPQRVEERLLKFPWIRRAHIRLREEGHVFIGEAYVELADSSDIEAKMEEAARAAEEVDWRLYDLTIMPLYPEEGRSSPGERENRSSSGSG